MLNDLELFADVGYMGFWFDIPTSPTLIIVEHNIQALTLGIGWNASLSKLFQPLSFVGRFKVGILGGWSEHGRIAGPAPSGKPFSLHGEAGLRWFFPSTESYVEGIWETFHHFYDYNLGHAHESYYMVGGRVGWAPTWK
ncbi:hypothetical protein ACFLRA_02085 [Bdellovibrionota bacterium]